MNIKDYGCKYFSNTEILSAFLREVRNYKVLTSEEEEKLISEYKNGSKTAKDELVNRNLRFIYSLAKMYSKNEDEVLDYVNEGVIGFISAMDTYDATLGYKFITYAVWYIRRSMNYYLIDTRNMVNRSNNAKLGKKLDRAKQKYYAKNGYEPPIEELKAIIKEEYNIDIKDDSDLYDVNVTSINEEVDDDYTVEEVSGFTKKTAFENDYEKCIENEHLKSIIEDAFNRIPNQYSMQVDIVKMLYGVGYDREYSEYEVCEKYRIKLEDVNAIKENMFSYIRQNSSIKVAL